MSTPPLYIGTAHWQLRREDKPFFPDEGSHLERYAQRLTGVEINSSFYRLHQPKTYKRWGLSVPPAFRFAVKVPKTITHGARLVGAEPLWLEFLEGPLELGARLGCLLVQLPPSLSFEVGIADAFFSFVRATYPGGLVFEPRHASWFAPPVDALLREHRVARVAADPAVVPEAGLPGGWDELVYYRLHGSPKMYHSPYDADDLDAIQERACVSAEAGVPTWCMFDNTASGAAVPNALELLARADDGA